MMRIVLFGNSKPSAPQETPYPEGTVCRVLGCLSQPGTQGRFVTVGEHEVVYCYSTSWWHYKCEPVITQDPWFCHHCLVPITPTDPDQFVKEDDLDLPSTPTPTPTPEEESELISFADPGCLSKVQGATGDESIQDSVRRS